MRLPTCEGSQQLEGTGGLALVVGAQQEEVSGVYVGEGVAPVQRKLAVKIWRWDFIEMSELLPEFWGLADERECLPRRTRVVADIFTWMPCFTLCECAEWAIPGGGARVNGLHGHDHQGKPGS